MFTFNPILCKPDAQGIDNNPIQRIEYKPV